MTTEVLGGQLSSMEFAPDFLAGCLGGKRQVAHNPGAALVLAALMETVSPVLNPDVK